ncbi:MAG: hypothetical protein DI549_08505 [Ancylobacter novellus]|uniref:Uncharacterized protein n=1 Tax=Ancylobacter novellus TaxID=921 RepID=A0A2W5R8T1_ANCNO|nr:MAG: hypothetical protein DI549_08505 [Ancylobacter novellus]
MTIIKAVLMPEQRPSRGLLSAVLLLLFVLAVSACTVRVGPDYDAALVQSFEKANEQAMVLFAKVDGGTSRNDFKAREDSYAGVIGAFGALKLATETRVHHPPPAWLKPAGAALDPSLDSERLAAIGYAFKRMKDEDAAHGLSASRVALDRADYESLYHQAITYEKRSQ